MNEELKAGVSDLILYLTQEVKEAVLRGDFNGVIHRIAVGFTEYLERSVLRPLQRLSAEGLYKEECATLEKIIEHLKSDWVPTDEEYGDCERKSALVAALHPFLNAHRALAGTAESVDNPSEIDSKNMEKALSQAWDEEVKHSRGGLEEAYQAVESSTVKHDPKDLMVRKLFLSLPFKMDAPAFFEKLRTTSNLIYHNRVEAGLDSALMSIMDAYHAFFERTSDRLLDVLNLRFGIGGEDVAAYATYFEVAKDCLAIDELSAPLQGMELNLTRSEMHVLSKLCEAVESKPVEKGGEYDSLFYAFFSHLFLRLTEAAKVRYEEQRALYLERVAGQSKAIGQHLKDKQLGVGASDLHDRVDEITRSLSEFIATKSLPIGFPKALAFLLVLAEKIVAIFRPRIRGLRKKRTGFLEARAKSAKYQFDSSKGEGAAIEAFRSALQSDQSPLTWRRGTSAKRTATCDQVDVLCAASGG